MKNTRVCPKCNASDIRRFNRYVCCRCGYSEEWIDRKDQSKKAKKR